MPPSSQHVRANPLSVHAALYKSKQNTQVSKHTVRSVLSQGGSLLSRIACSRAGRSAPAHSRPACVDVNIPGADSHAEDDKRKEDGHKAYDGKRVLREREASAPAHTPCRQFHKSERFTCQALLPSRSAFVCQNLCRAQLSDIARARTRGHSARAHASVCQAARRSLFWLGVPRHRLLLVTCAGKVDRYLLGNAWRPPFANNRAVRSNTPLLPIACDGVSLHRLWRASPPH